MRVEDESVAGAWGVVLGARMTVYSMNTVDQVGGGDVFLRDQWI